MPKDTPQVDHKAEALRLLGLTEGSRHDHTEWLIESALVYSNLAIAEGQERVAEQLSKIGKRLDSITDVSPNVKLGSGKRYLKVKP